MSINAFYCDLNDFCRKYLVGNAPVSKQDFAAFIPRQKSVDASTFENLMLFDKTMFKVYGENIPLAYLIGSSQNRGEERIDRQGSR